jgi:hypothetical protein
VIKLGELVMILDRTCVESLWWPDLREISNLNRLVEGSGAPQSLVGDFRYFGPCGAGFGRRSLLAVFQFRFRRCRDRFDSGQRAVCRAPFRTRRTPAGSPRPRKTLVSIYNVFELAARRS